MTSHVYCTLLLCIKNYKLSNVMELCNNHHFHWLFSNSILSNILDTGTSNLKDTSPRKKILDNVEQSSKKYNPALIPRPNSEQINHTYTKSTHKQIHHTVPTAKETHNYVAFGFVD